MLGYLPYTVSRIDSTLTRAASNGDAVVGKRGKSGFPGSIAWLCATQAVFIRPAHTSACEVGEQTTLLATRPCLIEWTQAKKGNLEFSVRRIRSIFITIGRLSFPIQIFFYFSHHFRVRNCFCTFFAPLSLFLFSFLSPRPFPPGLPFVPPHLGPSVRVPCLIAAN